MVIAAGGIQLLLLHLEGGESMKMQTYANRGKGGVHINANVRIYFLLDLAPSP